MSRRHDPLRPSTSHTPYPFRTVQSSTSQGWHRASQATHSDLDVISRLSVSHVRHLKEEDSVFGFQKPMSSCSSRRDKESRALVSSSSSRSLSRSPSRQKELNSFSITTPSSERPLSRCRSASSLFQSPYRHARQTPSLSHTNYNTPNKFGGLNHSQSQVRLSSSHSHRSTASLNNSFSRRNPSSTRKIKINQNVKKHEIRPFSAQVKSRGGPNKPIGYLGEEYNHRAAGSRSEYDEEEGVKLSKDDQKWLDEVIAHSKDR